eukprot:XP_017945965.1 PREDICTED: harmonin-like [Xenopus tropicalis]
MMGDIGGIGHWPVERSDAAWFALFAVFLIVPSPPWGRNVSSFVPYLPNTHPQKGKDRKKSKSDSLFEQKKSKKEMEFEQKLAQEKEEMLEKEKQLKINRLVQEVSETEREDLEESEKVQVWVERLCQTRLEQISSAENENHEVTGCCVPVAGSATQGYPGIQ